MTESISTRVRACYAELLQASGNSACSAIFAAAEERLPFPVQIQRAPAHTISGCAASGRAVTNFDQKIHTITLAEELPPPAASHTLAHEYFHLLHHLPSVDRIDDAVDYYATFPELKGIPRGVLRYLVQQSMTTMYRGRVDTIWEREAEAFAELVVTTAYARTLPASRSPLLIALGAPDARR